VLRVLDGGVRGGAAGDVQVIPSQVVRVMRRRKVERIGGKEERGAHQRRRDRPGIPAGRRNFGDELLRG
jgi:hypothetical protein